jgi:hypothetical protein
MEEILTGYQWMDNMTFGCVYPFYNNMDKEEILMPPKTTLVVPPSPIEGKEIYWTGSNWDYRDITSII